VKLAAFVKIRTYAKSEEELWLDEWVNPLQGQIPVTAEVVRDLQRSAEDDQKWGIGFCPSSVTDCSHPVVLILIKFQLVF